MKRLAPTIDAEQLSLTGEEKSKTKFSYFWSAPREIEWVGEDPSIKMSRCQGDCDYDRWVIDCSTEQDCVLIPFADTYHRRDCKPGLSCYERDNAGSSNPPFCLGDTIGGYD